jgi:hypothetical protein
MAAARFCRSLAAVEDVRRWAAYFAFHFPTLCLDLVAPPLPAGD